MAWYFLSNHGLILVYLHRHANATRPQIASAIGVTERHVSRLLGDLVREGALRRMRHDGGYIYEVSEAALARHPMMEGVNIGELLAVLGKGE